MDNTTEIPATDLGTIVRAANEQDVLASLAELRKKATQFVGDNMEASKAFTQRKNQLRATFLADLLRWGSVLMVKVNTPLRLRLFQEYGLQGTNDPLRAWENLAFIAMAEKDKNDDWVVVARRHERLGAQAHFIAANPEQYPLDEVASLLAVWGAFSKLDKAMKPKLTTAELDVIKKRRHTVSYHDAKKSEVKWPSATYDNKALFGLMLVSVHNGKVRLLEMVEGQAALTERVADRYCADRAPQIEAELLTAKNGQSGE